MKHYSEITQEIKDTYAAKRKAEEHAKAVESRWMAEYDRKKRWEVRKELTEEYAAAQEAVKDLELTMRFLKNNARIALFHDVMPEFLKILEKYKGKPYGPKTEQKIVDEVKEKTGARAYIYTRYKQDEVCISPVDGFGNDCAITVGIKHEVNGETNHLLIDNKIQVLPLECFSIWYINNNYFDDIPAAIRKMKELYRKAYEIQQELDRACSAFNKYAVGGIESLYIDKRIYERMV